MCNDYNSSIPLEVIYLKKIPYEKKVNLFVLMDKIFESGNYRNLVIRCRLSPWCRVRLSARISTR